jgi:uncharacterized protein YwbE
MTTNEKNSIFKLDKIMKVDWVNKQDKKIGQIPKKFIAQIKKRGMLPIANLIDEGFLKLEYQVLVTSSESHKRGKKPERQPLKV